MKHGKQHFTRHMANYRGVKLHLTTRLWARDFYEVIVDAAEDRINYRLIEIENE